MELKSLVWIDYKAATCNLRFHPGSSFSHIIKQHIRFSVCEPAREISFIFALLCFFFFCLDLFLFFDVLILIWQKHHTSKTPKQAFLVLFFSLNLRRGWEIKSNLVRAANGHYLIKHLGRGTALTLGGTTSFVLQQSLSTPKEEKKFNLVRDINK